MSDWQPIDSAPKDESAIIVYVPPAQWDSALITSVFWHNGHIDYWHVSDNRNEPYPLRGREPTHWMPLPEPPK